MKKTFTFAIASPRNGKILKLRVPQSLVLSGGISFILFLLVSFLASFHYASLNYRTRDYERLQRENGNLRTENHLFRSETRQLEEKLTSLQALSQKLTKMSGIGRHSDAVAGMGGPSNYPSFLYAGDRIEYLKDTMNDLQTEFRQLNDWYQRQNTLSAATPSIMPVRGYPSGGFGYRLDPISGRKDFHPGVDIASPFGNKIVATADGAVTFAGPRFGYGNAVIIDHRFGMSTLFGHMSRIVVRSGQHVRRGDILGYIGNTGRSTGPHLHYEVRLNDHPLNPMQFLRLRRG